MRSVSATASLDARERHRSSFIAAALVRRLGADPALARVDPRRWRGDVVRTLSTDDPGDALRGGVAEHDLATGAYVRLGRMVLSRVAQEHETREAKIAEAWRRATTEPRALDSVVHLPGLGQNYYCFTELPPFTPGHSWDVRRLQGEWAVFRSDVVEGASTRQLLGYQRLALRPRALDRKMSALGAMSLPIPAEPPFLVLRQDGTTYRFAVVRGGDAVMHLSWWEQGPPDWKPLRRAYRAILAIVRPLEPTAL